MIVLNQEKNMSVKMEEDVLKTIIEYDFSDYDLSRLTRLYTNFIYLSHYMHKPYEHHYKSKKSYKKALEDHNTEREATLASEKKQDERRRNAVEEIYTHNKHYKIKIDGVLYATYSKKEEAYKAYANMFIAYGNNDKVYEIPKEEIECGLEVKIESN